MPAALTRRRAVAESPGRTATLTSSLTSRHYKMLSPDRDPCTLCAVQYVLHESRSCCMRMTNLMLWKSERVFVGEQRESNNEGLDASWEFHKLPRATVLANDKKLHRLPRCGWFLLC